MFVVFCFIACDVVVVCLQGWESVWESVWEWACSVMAAACDGVHGHM